MAAVIRNTPNTVIILHNNYSRLAINYPFFPFKDKGIYPESGIENTCVMCSLEVNDSFKLNRSISDDEENQEKLESSGRILESRGSSESLLPFHPSPLDSKQLEIASEKHISKTYSINENAKHVRARPELMDDSPGQDERSPYINATSRNKCKSISPVRDPQRTVSRNSDLLRQFSPGQGRVKDSIARHNFHLSNFLAANPGHNLSSSASLRSGDRSLDLTDLFRPEENRPSTTAHYLENNAFRVEATSPEENGKVNSNPDSLNEKNLTFGKIRVRTHDVTESGQNLDWGHRNNSESFVLDDYEKRSFEKKTAQRKASKQKVISMTDAVGEKLEMDGTKRSSNETQGNCGVGSLAALQQPRDEALDEDEDFSSLRSGRSDMSSSSRVSFGEVRVRRHKLTLGDHPCVSQGPPVALDWSYMSSQHFDLEDYETISGDRQKAQKISREEREELLRTKGVSDDSLSRIEFEVQEIKASRKAVKDDKKKEDDIMIYKLLSSTSLREARLTTRRNVAETGIAHNNQKPRRDPTHLSDFQPTATENNLKQSATRKGDIASTEKPIPKLAPGRWRVSLKTMFWRKKHRDLAAADILPAPS